MVKKKTTLYWLIFYPEHHCIGPRCPAAPAPVWYPAGNGWSSNYVCSLLTISPALTHSLIHNSFNWQDVGRPAINTGRCKTENYCPPPQKLPPQFGIIRNNWRSHRNWLLRTVVFSAVATGGKQVRQNKWNHLNSHS